MLPARLNDIVVFPMSGYINRLQTIASAAILAEQYDARLRICWIPYSLAPSPADAVFSKSFCDEFIISEESVLELYQLEVNQIPIYVSRSRGMVSLRGADKGEQALMPEVERSIQQESPQLLAIVSGGSFFRDARGFTLNDYRKRKSDFYRALPLHSEIEGSVSKILRTHPSPYLGLHLRYTDRSDQAPLDRAIRKALRFQSEATGISSVFVAADSARSRDHWVAECVKLGLDPWCVNHLSMRREDALSAHPALIDWKLLGHASRLVYFTASSFAVEAAVMNGTWQLSSGLEPHPLRAGYVRVSEYAGAGYRRLRGGRS